MPCLINPRREKGEPLLNGPVLFYINPAEANWAQHRAQETGGRRHFLFNSNLWEVSGPKGRSLAVCGPALGAPAAVLSLEKLIALGGRQFIICGTCGSLNSRLKIGDVLLPTGARSAEGTSNHYPLSTPPVPAPSLLNILHGFLKAENIAWHNGRLWTTDAPYRETSDKVRDCQESDIYGVDMEFSALLTVAAFRGVELAAIMVVSDQLDENNCWQSGFKSPVFKQKMNTIRQGLFNCLRQNENE
ncbi:MAG TPA: phosphorylase [Desulfobacterales bacterium]|nr:phosphorylase [Desulfobacterales bacterium]